MKKSIKQTGAAIFLLILLVMNPVSVVSAQESSAAEEVVNAPSEQELYARGAVLMDASSGRVLYDKNGSEKMPNASTTKIMTCILLLEMGIPEGELIEVSPYAAAQPKVHLGMINGEHYKVGDLMYSMMLESHNDSAVALAEHAGRKYLSANADITSKEAVLLFVDAMNLKAKEIGCIDTTFVTPNGLDAVRTRVSTDTSPGLTEEVKKTESLNVPGTDETLDEFETIGIIGPAGTLESTGATEPAGTLGATETNEIHHGTTAADLALIMAYCVTKSPAKERFLEITQTNQHSFSEEQGKRLFTCINHNAFLSMMDGVISGKTGFTAKAGYCYVAALESSEKCYTLALLACGWPGNKTYKWQDSKKLFTYGLAAFDRHTLEECGGKPQAEKIPVLNGQGSGIGELAYTSAGVEKESWESLEKELLLKKGQSLKMEVHMPAWLEAPVTEGEEVGTVQIFAGEELWQECPVVATDNIDEIDSEWCIRQVIHRFLLF